MSGISLASWRSSDPGSTLLRCLGPRIVCFPLPIFESEIRSWGGRALGSPEMEKMRNDTNSMPRIRFLRRQDAEAVRARKHEGASVVALLTSPRGDVLLNLRDDKPGVLHPGHWAILGGGVEAGEELDEALRREVAEEIGYELGVAHEFCRIVDWEGNRHLVIVYVATIDATIDELHLGEGKEIRFFPPDEIARLKLSPFVKEVVSAFFEDSSS